ncbi:uncharacterized protein BDV14DRAFT_6190 [Aspergillus stella-maris]|uniref:uncharacterized protein n=1 Tax=Aspergillus stella-maris TaxID=1810926 RepID=UPI003CCDFE8F
MGKQTTITNSTFPNSSNPRLSRSEIINSTISTLDGGDCITRCYINASTISKERSCEGSRQSSIASAIPAGLGSEEAQHDPVDNGRRAKRQGRITIRLRRSEITSSTLHNTSLSKSTIARSTLNHIPRARSLHSTDSILDTLNPLRRATVSKSTISDGSALARSEINDSVVSKSAIVRSRVERSHISGSRVKKSKLVNCQKLGKPLGNEKGHGPEDWMGDLDSETESSGRDDSDTEEEDGHGHSYASGNEKDLPPPYTP